MNDIHAGPSSGSIPSHNSNHTHHGSISSTPFPQTQHKGESTLAFSKASNSAARADSLTVNDSPNTNSLPSGVSSLATSTSHVLIQSVVQRLTKRLPCNSGGRLSSLEEEESIRSSVANLVCHSEYQLSTVVKELLLVLESLNKQLPQVTIEDAFAIDIMQSQLFILQILVACLINTWKRSSGGEPIVQEMGDLNNLPKGWNDPPALEESLAKQILSVMTFYLRLTVAREDSILNASMDTIGTKIDITNRSGANERSRQATWDDTDKEEAPDRSSLTTLALSNGAGLFLLQPSFPPSRSPFQVSANGPHTAKHLPRFKSNPTLNAFSPTTFSSTNEKDDSKDVHLVIQNIYRQASQVIFYLSSSNWPVIYARIRNRLSYLSTTLEETPNTSELRLLECSNIQRARLGSILQELCTSFLHLKRLAQQTVALVLRRTVQAWIQYHPAEYAQLYASNRRLEGGPDLLFDVIFNLADSTRKKVIFWPVLTSLLILCPDIVSKIAIDDGRKSGSLGKKSSFLVMLKKGLRSNKLSDVSALCCVDICSAATACTKGDSALRLLVPDIEADLKEKLFDARKPSINSTTGTVELPLMVTGFVAFFRLDPHKTLSEIAPILMNDSSPFTFKTTMIKACIQIASERDRLPWNPSISLLYPLVSPSMRKLFKEIVYRLRSSEDGISLKKPFAFRPKVGEDDVANQLEMLQVILLLWTMNIEAIHHGISYESSTTLTSLAGSKTVFDAQELFQNAISADSIIALMYVLTRAAYSTLNQQTHNRSSGLMQICLGDHAPNEQFLLQAKASLISCSAQSNIRIAALLMSSETLHEQRHWLTILQRILQRKYALLATKEYNQDMSSYPSLTEMKHERERIEMALLLTISSADTDICAMVLQACKYASKLEDEIQSQEDDEWARLSGILGQSDLVQTGRIAQQKRIRSCLRDVSMCSAAAYAAWREAYRRWTALTLIVAKPLQDSNPEAAQEKAAQWHNYAGFLAALGGACAVEEAPEMQQAFKSSYSNNFTSKDDSPIELVDNFIHEMVDLLVSNSIWVREKVKESLGADTSPKLIGVLFRAIHSVLSNFFDKMTGKPKPSEMYSIFVENGISVLQMILARLPLEPTEDTQGVDIGALIVLFVEYLNTLGKREQAARMRAQMCQLCEQLMKKKSFFTFNNELRVRNRLFKVLTNWTTESIEETSSNEKLDRLQRDLDVQCLRTISVLLDKLPLILTEDTPLLDDSVEWAKSRHFSTSFNYFIKVLNRVKAIEQSKDNSSVTLNRSNKENMSLRDLIPLKQSAVLALSNLLASNISTGLPHSLSLAYSEDLQLRTAFMQIMTMVLDQGIAFEHLEYLNASQKQSELIELISEPDLQLALSVCQVCRGYDIDNMDSILLNIFDSKGGIIRFLKAALSEEIDKTVSEEMVFRSNSLRTHLLSLYGRTHGYEYLRSIMTPLITEMANKPKGYSFEIDTQKLDPGENASINQNRLEEMAQAFIDEICNSAHRVPAVLRELCRHIRQLMDSKFPVSRYQGVGGFIFLRFINPAVVAPQLIDIQVTGSGKEFRRGLLLISKILQTLASNTLFPQHKEPFMTGLNDFLKRNVWKVTSFLDQVSDTRTDSDRLLSADQPLGFGINPFGVTIDKEDQNILHKFFYENVDKIGKELLTRTSEGQSSELPSGFSSSSSSSSGIASKSRRVNEAIGPKKVYEQLCVALAEMGDYRQDATTNAIQEAYPVLLSDFMKKHSSRNANNEEYRLIFYKGPPSRAGRPVFYYNSWAQNAQTVDYEAFIYYVFQTMQPYMAQPFDVVFDCTGAQPNNMTPIHWLIHIVNLLPVEFATNIRNMFGYNVNTTCRLYTKTWMSVAERSNAQPMNGKTVLSQLQNNVNIVYCMNITDLEPYIEKGNIALQSNTMSISSLPEVMRFDQVTMVWYYRSLVPVRFKVSETHLQINATKTQSIFKNSSGLLNEVIHLADINDVRAVSIRGDDNTFSITCNGGTISFLFISKDQEEIVQYLRQAKARVSWFNNHTTNKAIHRNLMPSDVPGTLLNVAMLNITSHDHHLRLSAYDLLCALSTNFNFGASNAKRKLLSTRGLALSANTMTFVVELSREFAIATPEVTLEFLSSFFQSFEKASSSQKMACLQYMAPWLSNLAMYTHSPREELSNYQNRIKEILLHLIAITVKLPDMYTTTQRNVWSQFSKIDDLIPLLLDVFLEAAMDSGLHTSHFDTIIDTMISFASINLRGKLLAKLRRSISKTAQNATMAVQLHDNAAWKEIVTLLRMNMVLSFSSRMDTLLYLPEILHIILLLAGNGNDVTRYSIHSTTINMIHSLCTGDISRTSRQRSNSQGRKESSVAVAMSPMVSSHPAISEADYSSLENAEGMNKLRILLLQLSEKESLDQFGLSTDVNFNSASPFDTSSTMIRETPSNQSIAKLAFELYQVVDMAAPSIDTSNAWRARLTSLVISTAFQYNPIIQSRAFILLGCLADVTGSMLNDEITKVSSLFEVDDDLLYQILVSLRGSIQEWANTANDTLIISIVTCLSKVVKILSDKSRYLPQMFWLGISMIQYGYIPLFKAGIDLMITTIKSICHRNLPERNQTDLITYLLDGRFEFREEAIRLDDETGVDFEAYFSFAMASLVVKGLRHPLTKEPTIELLQCMLKYSATDGQGDTTSSNGRVSTMQLGFFIALLPTATRRNEFANLLQLAGAKEDHIRYLREYNREGGKERGVEKEERETGLYDHLYQPMENKLALLVITLLASLLRHRTVSDPEKQQLYRFLADSTKQFPAIVSILYEYLLPNIKEIYLNSQNEDILQSVDAITQIAISEPIFQLQFQETKNRGGAEAYLEESGYASLLDCDDFIPLRDSRRVTLARLSSALLSGLIDAGTA